MKRRLIVILFVSTIVFMAAGCAEKRAYFGVPNAAITVPDAFDQTDKAISDAERSPGAKYCPDKIERAKKLAREGVEDYWACFTDRAMDKLAQARALANEATKCQPPAPPARPTPPPPPPPPAVRVPEAVVITNAFSFDSLQLHPEALRQLDQQADVMKKIPEVRVQIIGHTDGIGTTTYNQELGKRRALSAKEYLEKKGIAPARMEVRSEGKQHPIAPNNTEQGRATNRRIELRYVK